MIYSVVALPDEESKAILQTQLELLQNKYEGICALDDRYQNFELVKLKVDDQATLHQIQVKLKQLTGYQQDVNTTKVMKLDEGILKVRMPKDSFLRKLQDKVYFAFKDDQGIQEMSRCDLYYPLVLIDEGVDVSKVKNFLKAQGSFAFKICKIAFVKQDLQGYQMVEEFEFNEEPLQYVYIVECGDHSYYTGWTNHLKERILAHQNQKGAKYTKSRQPVKLVYYETFTSKSVAMKREYEIKQYNRKVKEALIHSDKNCLN